MGDVVVVGSINVDLVAFAERHPGPGETVRGSELQVHPGGKGANAAVAAARAGASTRLVGMVGADAFGERARAFLAGEGLDLSGVAVAADVPTGTALITVAAAENTIVVVPGANDRLDPAALETLALRAGDVVVSQFEIRQVAVVAAFRRARAAGARTILNPAPAAAPLPELRELTDALVVNESELARLAGSRPARPDRSAVVAAARRLRRSRDQDVIATLGARGVLALHGGEVIVAEGRPVRAVDTTAAGDCFVGNLAAGLAAGRPFADAVSLANCAAALCIQAPGAAESMPRRHEVEAALR